MKSTILTNISMFFLLKGSDNYLNIYYFLFWRRKWQTMPVFLAWKIPWTKEPGVQYKGLKRVNTTEQVTNTCTRIFMKGLDQRRI